MTIGICNKNGTFMRQAGAPLLQDKDMIVVGIDPGIARVGYGVLERTNRYPVPLTYGCIETKSSLSQSQRLREIYETISQVLDDYNPACVAIEQLFFSRNTTSAMQVSEARGVLLLAVEQRDIEIAEYTPNQIKQAVTGSGRADKHQVQEMMRRLLRLQEIPCPDDAADGLAVALCHIHTMR